MHSLLSKYIVYKDNLMVFCLPKKIFLHQYHSNDMIDLVHIVQLHHLVMVTLEEFQYMKQDLVYIVDTKDFIRKDLEE